MKIRTILFGLLAVATVSGCAPSTLQTFMRNLSASDCATPATQQTFVGNLPGILGVPEAQLLFAVSQACAASFGTVAAPTPAPGMTGAFPAPTPTVVPSPVATPAPAAAKAS